VSAPAAAFHLPGRTSQQAATGSGRRQAAPDASNSAIRVMIVDDSLTVRTIFKRMVESDGSMAIIGTASSAERAIAQLAKTPADVVLLDLEMPGVGGLKALPDILKAAQGGQVLVVSSLTQDGAEHTVSALSMGAADTMLKPRPGGFNEKYRAQLLGKIRALGEALARKEVGAQQAKDTAADAAPLASPPLWQQPAARTISARRPEVIAIGASTGGIHALNILMRGLPRDFDLPILVTQHLPASFIPVFARQIEMACDRPAVIAEDGTLIRSGTVTIATGHGHMVVSRKGDNLVANTSSKPAPSGCLPSVDPMFASLAKACGDRVLGVVLSGMGRDGAQGARELVAAGGRVIAQDSETSAVWGMPGAVAKAGLASLVASPEILAREMLAAARNHTSSSAA